MRPNTSPDSKERAARASSVREEASRSADDHRVEERPISVAGGPITLYHRDGHYIGAELNAEGSLVISGQDLRPSNGCEEYEYAFKIAPRDFTFINAALDGTYDSVLDLLAANAERIVPGVQSWLRAIGAHYEFWSRIETDHG